MIEISEREYTIGEAAEILHEEIHNLRYWQRELRLPDHRNEMNQRVYTQTDINTFKFVKELRTNENLSLKAIRKILKKTDMVRDDDTAVSTVTTEVMSANNVNYTAVINKLREDICTHIGQYIENSNQELKEEIEQLRYRLEYLDDERNRKLDQLIFEWREKNRKKTLKEKIFGK